MTVDAAFRIAQLADKLEKVSPDLSKELRHLVQTYNSFPETRGTYAISPRFFFKETKTLIEKEGGEIIKFKKPIVHTSKHDFEYFEDAISKGCNEENAS